jgi:hypothetical protein
VKECYIEQMTYIKWYKVDSGNGYIQLKNDEGHTLLLKQYMIDLLFYVVEL